MHHHRPRPRHRHRTTAVTVALQALWPLLTVAVVAYIVAPALQALTHRLALLVIP